MIRNALTGEPRDKPHEATPGHPEFPGSPTGERAPPRGGSLGGARDPQQTEHQGVETGDRAPPLPAAVVSAAMTGADLTPEAGPTLLR